MQSLFMSIHLRQQQSEVPAVAELTALSIGAREEPQSHHRVPGAGPRGRLAGTRPRCRRASPLLPALAQQDADALVQRGPAGLVCEEGQEVGAEGRYLGTCRTLALGKKDEMMVPTGLRPAVGSDQLRKPPRNRHKGHFQ